jgi:hypothetical protein
MTKYTQKSLLALALLAAFTAPLALAQDKAQANGTNQTSPATIPSDPTSSTAPAVQAPASASNDIAPKPSSGQKTWEELDANKDGNLSKAEAAADASMKALFAKADANGDGSLTPEEYRAYYEKYVAKTSH